MLDRSGGLGINFGEAWEIEDIDEESQAEVLGLRPAIWLSHIQGDLIVGKPGQPASPCTIHMPVRIFTLAYVCV